MKHWEQIDGEPFGAGEVEIAVGHWGHRDFVVVGPEEVVMRWWRGEMGSIYDPPQAEGVRFVEGGVWWRWEKGGGWRWEKGGGWIEEVS